jgi:phosphoglycolate phosphatase
MIKLVAFDLDGTIGETIPMCIAAFNKAVSPYVNQKLTEREIIQTFGLNEEGMIKKVAGKNWQKGLNDFYLRYQEMHVMCPHPFEGVKELIAELKMRNITLALVTGKGEKSCLITLLQFGMENDFDSIKTGSPDKNIKAEALSELQHKYALSSDELIYVGDTVSDIVSCNQVGVKCLSAGWADSAELKQLEEHNKGYVFQTIQLLKEYIFKCL